MAKLWLFGAITFAQTLSLQKLILYAEGTYEAHWTINWTGAPPYEVRLPGRLTRLIPLQGTGPALFSWETEPDTLWGPFHPSGPLVPNGFPVPLGTSLTASYQAGDEIEELKGTLHAYTPTHLLIRVQNDLYWLPLANLTELQYPASAQGASIYPATRLRLYPEAPGDEASFQLIAQGTLPDSLRFLYLIAPKENQSYQLTAWLQIPPLFPGTYETALELRTDHRHWPLGRQRLPLHRILTLRLSQTALVGKEGYAFSLPPLDPTPDTTRHEAIAQKVLLLTASEDLQLPPLSEGLLIDKNGSTFPFLWQKALTSPRTLRIELEPAPDLQASLQEVRRKTDKKSPPARLGTIRLRSALPQEAAILIEKRLIGSPLPAESGLARLEKHPASSNHHILRWEVVLLHQQAISLSYAYVP